MSVEHGVQGAGQAGKNRVVVFFAVRDEARHFHPPPGGGCKVLFTGIGSRQAERTFLHQFGSKDPGSPLPHLVLTCGYAGALAETLRLGQVVFEGDSETGLGGSLAALGGRLARFHCSTSIAVTAESKRVLRAQTGADAVEMESGIIRQLCRERGIPSATVRVISDDAGTDLPLDFNQFARPEGNISYASLAWALIRSPGTVGRLMGFRRDLNVAAQRLGEVLTTLMRERAG